MNFVVRLVKPHPDMHEGIAVVGIAVEFNSRRQEFQVLWPIFTRDRVLWRADEVLIADLYSIGYGTACNLLSEPPTRDGYPDNRYLLRVSNFFKDGFERTLIVPIEGLERKPLLRDVGYGTIHWHEGVKTPGVKVLSQYIAIHVIGEIGEGLFPVSVGEAIQVLKEAKGHLEMVYKSVNFLDKIPVTTRFSD